VKVTPLLDRDPTVTITLPEDAPGGTSTVMLPGLQLLAAAAGVPLNVTMLEPWVAPKLVPVIVTELPTGAEVGFNPVILGIDCVMVIVAAADFVGSATDVAVSVTVGGLGTTDGATYASV